MSILCIVGPTASGKSSLAIEAAQHCNGEIVCVDSQTIRRELTIGTAKPSVTDQKLVRHHMLDIIDPYDRFTAAEFKQQADKVIADIKSRGKTPILVGGTGLYMDAIVFNFEFNEKADDKMRAYLNKKSINELQIMAHEKSVMPANNKNKRHLIRALETSGRSAGSSKPKERTVIVGLDPGTVLADRISVRVDNMLDQGFVSEVQAVVSKYGKPPSDWDAIGYKLVYELIFKHKIEPENATEAVRAKLNSSHKKYAKRQRTWFRRYKDIVWFEQRSDAMQYIRNRL